MNLSNYRALRGWLLTTVSLGFCLFSYANPFHGTQPTSENLFVVRNNTLIFDALESSTEILQVEIVAKPAFGKIRINADYTISFIPELDFCGKKDDFSYAVITEAGRKVYNKSVEILCDSVTIVTGFSPDGDGENDYLTVVGIENYPANRLSIFNKWGEEVFSAKGYKNNWNGVDKDGLPLPAEDSVYYYVFEDGEGEIYSGYVTINYK